ncbi:hypothetical protein H257_07358 [Aphanomyces astaci]|uniref:Complex 1 LYR protein domain-containing protein n=1 Tax=Aphanomyces astaci TaxID=112090 RepID=W4GHW6_APHAT|nr:hypothetical protein H257_07358 [Aphanomyces astaci]ETV79310.1 hypothetical protein H257_07358 [Aphanomyces astaci]KAF0775642.1 hypothetical protein AaE_000659 [Aphanomyces astaci]RHY09359.1 hypothetical protein DYB25_003247 [Aphanomyces astaci]RHY17171.1 hypothetical protein DYB36_004256 [Aphanomyces astaci]RHY38881.1 hypothetical protein DYB38_008857 [Aphanomyces astaci]|eukprot:XP_009831151.1 hypothetical protein H257_07358 [Aphanomyces astaci]
MSSSPTVPQIYRRVLQLANKFPSIKQKQLVQDIKLEFHENKALTDPAKIKEKINIAIKGIQQLNQYVALDPNAQSWSVDMDKDPFGQNHPDRPASINP